MKELNRYLSPMQSSLCYWIRKEIDNIKPRWCKEHEDWTLYLFSPENQWVAHIHNSQHKFTVWLLHFILLLSSSLLYLITLAPFSHFSSFIAFSLLIIWSIALVDHGRFYRWLCACVCVFLGYVCGASVWSHTKCSTMWFWFSSSLTVSPLPWKDLTYRLIAR